MQIDLEIGGMTCGGCVRSVTRVLEAVPGVKTANVELEKARARIEGEALDPATLIAAIEDAGFDARLAG